MAKRPKIQYGTPAPGAPGSKSASTGATNGPIGVKIAIGVAVLAVLITIVVFAAQDSGGDAGNDVAFQRAEVTGTPLPQMTEGADDPAIGQTIPTVEGKSFDGTPVTIEPGKPQVVAFLAHWCPHCQAEVPKLVEWQASGELTDDVELIAVSTSANEAQGNFPPASWLEREDWSNTTLVDTPTSAVLKAFGVAGFPTLIAVKADGTVAQRASGELALDQVQQLWEAARGKDVGDISDSEESSNVPTTTVAP